MLCIGVISNCGSGHASSREGRKLGQNTEEDNNERGNEWIQKSENNRETWERTYCSVIFFTITGLKKCLFFFSFSF